MEEKRAAEPEVLWHEERETLTLDGEPVLEYALAWPEITGAGRGGRRISRYYVRLAEVWRRRWRQEVYIKSCLALAACRAEARPYAPWTGRLKGEAALLEDGLLSLRLWGQEVRGDRQTSQVRWGETWKLQEGAPCTLKEVCQGEKGWKRKLLCKLYEQGEQRRTAGDCFLDRDWTRKALKLFPKEDFCLTAEGIELAFPQCALSPAAEGTPVFLLPRPGQKSFSEKEGLTP